MKFKGQYLNATETAYLADWLGTTVLEYIAHLSSDNVLFGQTASPRVSSQKSCPSMSRYTGFLDWNDRDCLRYVFPGIAVVLEGSLTELIGEVVYEAQGGDWLILTPEVAHREFHTRSKASYHVLWFQFNGGVPALTETSYTAKGGFVLNKYASNLTLPVTIQKAVDSVLRGPGQPARQLRSNLLQITAWWLDVLNAAANESVVHAHPIVERILEVLKEGATFSVGELAKEMGISLSYMSSLFKRFTGHTIRHAMQKARLEKGQQYLADPTLSIKEIAYRLGFADPQHFAHTFHRLVGVSPGAYRRLLNTGMDK